MLYKKSLKVTTLVLGSKNVECVDNDGVELRGLMHCLLLPLDSLHPGIPQTVDHRTNRNMTKNESRIPSKFV
ncbi:hypothetical protein BC938DRAFT_471899 [Jimgerdemannia flammicorona]|uniref:Uncharacterized protein n=1 Tax=Jimgerdemannia flammicorona TaxID=994334 RepID=A0A433Q761_9FUNG|nr:hypothetical protein BC938DRAFT_471899 [Jimgerdemannia flammicorona]